MLRKLPALQHCKECNTSDQVKAMTADFFTDVWSTQGFWQEQIVDKNIGSMLRSKEEGYILKWKLSAIVLKLSWKYRYHHTIDST